MSQTRPSVLFVCVKNGGKSQMAAALMRAAGGARVEVHSAGTHPGPGLNAESAASVAELGATFEGENPKPIDPALLARVDRVVIIGEEAHLAEPGTAEPGTARPRAARVERWLTDEPSLRGITGPERMDLIRDDLNARVHTLLKDLTAQ